LQHYVADEGHDRAHDERREPYLHDLRQSCDGGTQDVDQAGEQDGAADSHGAGTGLRPVERVGSFGLCERNFLAKERRDVVRQAFEERRDRASVLERCTRALRISGLD